MATLGQRIGYVRVSTFDQNAERQLEGVAVDRTFLDKKSGKDVDREQLEAMMVFVRQGDTVVVHSMDRLAEILMTCVVLFKPSPTKAFVSSLSKKACRLPARIRRWQI